jgi:hypothetical protein
VIHIWVRRTVDWADEAAFLAQARPKHRPKIELWNATFNLPYHVFRGRVRDIAALNHSRVEDAACVGWDEIPDGALVVPVDDDDWFAPDLATALERSGDARGKTGYLWPSSFIEVPIDYRHQLGTLRRRVFPRTPPKLVCATNNYAMFKSPETEPLLDNHLIANEWGENGGTRNLVPVERRLSVMNRTLASQTTLRPPKPSITRTYLLWKYRRYRRLYRRVDLSRLPWARPYVAMMLELMDRLDVRGRRRGPARE